MSIKIKSIKKVNLFFESGIEFNSEVESDEGCILDVMPLTFLEAFKARIEDVIKSKTAAPVKKKKVTKKKVAKKKAKG